MNAFDTTSNASADTSGAFRPATLSLLLLEDNPLDVRLMQESLREVIAQGLVTLQVVRRLADALHEIRRMSFSCVLVDLGLPDGQGVGNVEVLRAADRSVAIVVLTGLDDDVSASKALELGAQEYVVKGDYDPATLLKLVRHAVQRNRQVYELQDQRDREFFQASHDLLTGLANRQLFEDHTRMLLAQNRAGGSGCAVCFIDLDGFKAVNDLHGHEFGDAVLTRVGQILAESVRETDTVARFGGDEFVVLLSPVDDVQGPGFVARRMLDRIQAVRQLGGQQITLSASIGIALSSADCADLESLLRNADAAMYDAKRGGGGVQYFAASMQVPAERPRELRLEIADGLEHDEFGVWYHPWVDLTQQRFVGVEVLLRWNHEERLRRPDEFLPAAEQSGQIREIGLVVARKACTQWRQWKISGLDIGLLALNVSDAQAADEEYLAYLLSILAAAEIPPQQVQLELRASVLSSDSAAAQIRRLRDHGLRVVLDQFSAEGAALRALTLTPLDGVKLDRRLLRALAEEGMHGSARRCIAATLGAGRALGLPVLCGGVESPEDLAALSLLGCTQLQGTLFADFVSAADLPRLIRQGPQNLPT